ncbi:pseudouridine synthase [Paenibacillus hodogayensis]|uniref:Pseudouridine synthase n=1 Tax=Paenibacillus hodogayensis TaxID=279208 RepID=A0ABV5VXF3_9BACL
MGKKQRVDKILSNMGFGSRSEIRRLVKQGAVKVGGATIKDFGLQVDPELDVIEVGEERVVFREFVYVMLNKPQGVISATEDSRDRTVVDLLSDEYRHFDAFPVGRLDKDTEGLLLLTNDGKLAHNLLSPRKHVPKTYYAEVEGRVGEEDKDAFRRGVTLDDGYVTMPAELLVLREGSPEAGVVSKIELTIMEGKFHQVKRMFQAVGKKVVYLKRIAMGSLLLDEHLAAGQYRELTVEELEQLRGHTDQ